MEKEKLDKIVKQNDEILERLTKGTVEPPKKKSVPSSAETDCSGYALTESVLTEAEKDFCAALMQATHGKFYVLTKIRIEDVIYVKRKGREKTAINSDRGRIKPRHFDFILCDEQGSPKAAVELDDPSHKSKKAQATDAFKDALCEAVGLPMIRFDVADTYEDEAISKRLP